MSNDAAGVSMTKGSSRPFSTPTPFSIGQRVFAFCARILVIACATGLAWAQIGNTQNAAAPATAPLPGPQVLSVSAYAAYYSSGLPQAGISSQGNSANLPSDGGVGGSIVFGWSKFTERTTFSLRYTPSYTADVRYSSLDALNHAFSFNVNRKLAPRWSLGLSAAASYSTQEESLFAPSTLGNVASVPANFSQLSAALLSGNFTSNQPLGVALSGAPLVQSPLANLLYGQRVLTSSAQSTLSYSFSPRLSLTLSGGGGRAQYLAPNQSSNASSSSLLLNTTFGTASSVLSYSLSPTTQMGGTVSTNWVSSSLEDILTTTSMATFGQTLGKKWIIQLHGGVGVINPVGSTSFATPNLAIQTSASPVFGGSLAFKTTSHALLGSFDRTASDSYGLGASSSLTGSVTWRWRHPGSLWALESSFSSQQLQGNAVTSTSGWQATAGVNRAVGSHLALLWQYTYLKYSGGLQTSVYTFSESAVRISTIWTPTPNVPR